MNVLVLCTGNSCRSQIAHGFIAQLYPKVNVYSAGIQTHGVNTKAIEVMRELDIDISNHTSNHIDEYKEISFDLIFTVCDHASESCPFIPGNHRVIHHNFYDPAKAEGSEEEIMNAFRRVRDEIKQFCSENLSLDS